MVPGPVKSFREQNSALPLAASRATHQTFLWPSCFHLATGTLGEP
jgi:hypothetical protein